MSISTQKPLVTATNTGDVISGGLFGIGGIVALTAMDAVAKGLGSSLPTSEVVFVRYIGSVAWLALFLAVSRGAWPKRRNLRRHAARGCLMALTAWLFFYAIGHLPLAIATALAMSAPVYVSLMGVVLLKETASRALVFAIALGIAGSLIIVFGGQGGGDLSGGQGVLAWGAAILAPVTYAGGLVLLKHHSGDEGGAAMTLAQSAFAAIVVLPFAAPSLVVPPPATWSSVVLIGLLGGVGYLLLLGGLRRIPASVFALVDYTALLWAAFFGFVFFSEVVELSIWIGGAMIIAACAVGMRARSQ